ncbi:mitochondrial proton/calcium exchanger protein-like protein isoform X1, partial [Tanacetum coccineum]
MEQCKSFIPRIKAIYGRNPKQIYGESAKRHEENSNLIKEIRASTDAAIRNQGASIKTLEIQIRQMSKVLQERGFGSLPSSTETNPRDHVKSISTIVEADASSIRHKKGSYGPQFSKAYSCGASHIDKSIPRKEKGPGSFTLPCYINNVFFDNALADLGASVNRTVKYPKGIAENVLVERMELDLEARLMGETLVLNRSLDIFFEDYTELNDLNVPLELKRDQVDDLMPTIEEGEVVEEFRARNDVRMVSRIFGYPNFAVLEDMDAYRDEGMGDVIFGEPFLREVRINARRFEGMITIYNVNKEVTYQMVRSHPRFKHHTNEQCNKIPPLLKDLAAKKLTKLVKYQSSGILCVIVVMLAFRRIVLYKVVDIATCLVKYGMIGKLTVTGTPTQNSTCLGLRKKYRLNLKNDMLLRDNARYKGLKVFLCAAGRTHEIALRQVTSGDNDRLLRTVASVEKCLNVNACHGLMLLKHDGQFIVTELNKLQWTSSSVPKEMEAVMIIDVLRRAKAEVVVASVRNKLEIVASRKVKLVADMLLDEAAK